MESQVKAAAEAVKEYVKKWEGVSDEMYKKYIAADDTKIATYTTHAADLEDLKEAISKLDKLASIVQTVPAAAGMYRGGGQPGTQTIRTLLQTMEKKINEAKKSKPPPAPPKPPAAAKPASAAKTGKPPIAPPKPASAAGAARPSPNAGRPLPKPPIKKNAYADPNKR